MAFCRNCGSEVGDGIRFCTNCGAAVDDSNSASYDYEFSRVKQNMRDEISRSGRLQKEKREESGFEKFSKFFGIILLLIAIVVFYSDPPILTIVLSIAIIAGAIFCLCQRYRLKGFTITALILALFCFFAGISQGKKLGFLKIPKDTDYAAMYSADTLEEKAPLTQVETDKNEVAATTDKPNKEETPKTVEKADTDTNKQAETIDGVDPELKAFLDSYEEFMDEYIAFMKKYAEDPGNAVSMLGEYAAIMEKYAEFADAVEKYDDKKMSTADAKYYLEVTTRINQKMLELY